MQIRCLPLHFDKLIPVAVGDIYIIISGILNK